jgi:membrane peptidoglycan carboxypeptidase
MQLTPKQMAFLVSLVPGPIKYQRSFEGGRMTPFFEGLVATLLAKMRSVDALTEEEYATALVEPLELRVGLPTDAAPTEAVALELLAPHEPCWTLSRVGCGDGAPR